MADLFASGAIALAILGFMAAEVVLLTIYWRINGLDHSVYDLVLTLVAGGGLVLALGAALSGATWPLIASFLMVALIGHAADIYRRFIRN